jgi:hypothetical protein
MNRAHIVTIKQNGRAVGHQLRTGSGAGQSTYFAVSTHGGVRKALDAAANDAIARGLDISKGRGGSEKGRQTVRSKTPAAGIRWAWFPFHGSANLRVFATWTDKTGKGRNTSYSVEFNGLEGALDLAIAKRVASGAPQPNKRALLAALRRDFKAGPDGGVA